MSSIIFDKFSEIKPKEYSYNISIFSEWHWDTYYRHKFNDVKGRTYYATMLGCQNFPTAYIAFDKEYITKTTLIEIQKYKDECFNYEYDYFNRNGNFTQEFTYYEERNNKIILGWDYAHCKDYCITNTDGEKHTTESVIDDIRQTIKEMDVFLFS
jgi:hypothetical protein